MQLHMQLHMLCFIIITIIYCGDPCTEAYNVFFEDRMQYVVKTVYNYL